jgi:hypothetical protein
MAMSKPVVTLDWLQAERELKRGIPNSVWGSATADIDTLRLLNCHGLGDC